MNIKHISNLWDILHFHSLKYWNVPRVIFNIYILDYVYINSHRCAPIIVFKQASLTYMKEHTFIHAHMHTCPYKKLLLLWWFPLKAVLMYSVKCMSEALKFYRPAVLFLCLIKWLMFAMSDLKQWPMTSQKNNSYKQCRVSCVTFAKYFSTKTCISITKHQWISRRQFNSIPKKCIIINILNEINREMLICLQQYENDMHTPSPLNYN